MKEEESPPEMSSSDEEHLPLQDDIPKEHLPEILHVYDKHGAALFQFLIPLLVRRIFDENGDHDILKEARSSLMSFLARCPVNFVRKYPVPVSTKDEEVIGDRGTIGQLDLSQGQGVDTGGQIGSHSHLFLAPFTLPSRAAAPSLCGEVAVKLATSDRRDRKMLENEAIIYNKFPCELQQSTASSPPIVPKFFGYYTACCDIELADSYEDEHYGSSVRKVIRELLEEVSPILLLEHCGKPVKADVLTGSNRDTIVGIYDRLHNAKFIQRSVFRRNILVQPGPLTLPRAERSIDNPSYRLIDFGRGECYDGDESHAADETIEKERRDLRSRIFHGGL